jgi:hypothetical protein
MSHEFDGLDATEKAGISHQDTLRPHQLLIGAICHIQGVGVSRLTSSETEAGIPSETQSRQQKKHDLSRASGSIAADHQGASLWPPWRRQRRPPTRAVDQPFHGPNLRRPNPLLGRRLVRDDIVDVAVLRALSAAIRSPRRRGRARSQVAEGQTPWLFLS